MIPAIIGGLCAYGISWAIGSAITSSNRWAPCLVGVGLAVGNVIAILRVKGVI